MFLKHILFTDLQEDSIETVALAIQSQVMMY